MRTSLSLILLAALAGSAVHASKPEPVNPKGEAQLAKLLAGRVAGKPVSCITTSTNPNTQVIDGTAIVYSDVGRTLYVNRPVSGASSLDNDSILVTKQWGSQLCNVDIVHLVDRNSRFPRGFVSLGQFVPYTKPKAD